MSKAIPEMVSETRIMAGRIGRMTVNETVSIDELQRLIGVSEWTNKHEGYLRSARHVAEREQGVVTARVRKVGVKRLGADNLHAVGDDFLGRMRRGARRTTKCLLTGASNLQMSQEQRSEVFSRVSLISLAAEVGKVKSLEATKAAVIANGNGEISIAKTIELFRGTSG